LHLAVKYCSKECYWQNLRDGIGVKKPYKQVTVNCRECGKEFNTIRAKYCSVECSLKHTAIRLQDVDYSFQKGPRIERVKRICKTCGKEFHVLPYEVKSRPCKYCSNICQIKAIGALNETSIEKAIREELEKREIDFIPQAQIGAYFADFKIGNVIIECDGEYWHNLPENKTRDKAKNRLYRKLGYKVFRFTDKEINKDAAACVDKAAAAIFPLQLSICNAI